MFTTAAPCTPSLAPLAAEAAPPAAPHRARSPAQELSRHRHRRSVPTRRPLPQRPQFLVIGRDQLRQPEVHGFSARAGIALNGQAVCRAGAPYPVASQGGNDSGEILAEPPEIAARRKNPIV